MIDMGIIVVAVFGFIAIGSLIEGRRRDRDFAEYTVGYSFIRDPALFEPGEIDGPEYDIEVYDWECQGE